MLNYESIKSRNLIKDSDNSNYRNASYDIRVEKIITPDGKEHSSFFIKPNSVVIVTSKETINLPNNVIGHAYVKTRLSNQGIMANNIGIIDTEYKGKLSSVLVNFGKSDFEIKEDMTFLRITFTEITLPSNSIPISYGPFTNNEYLNLRKIDAMLCLGDSFIDIDKATKKVTQMAKSEIRESFTKTATVWGIWTGALALLLTAIALFVGLRNDSINENTVQKVENLQNQINTFNKNQVLLLNIHEELKNNIVSLESEIDSVTLKNKKLKEEIEKYKLELGKNVSNKGK